MTEKSLLFISNGFAEDMVAAALVKELQKTNPPLKICALPIVGDGVPYQKLGVQLIGPHWELPSQGITYGKEFDVWKEIRGGAIHLYLGKMLALLLKRKKFDLVVGVGDFLSSVIAGVFVKKPLVYSWVTASHFDGMAKHFLKKYSVMIFSRWRKWEHLPEFNVEFVGNPNLDTFEISGDDFGIDKSVKTIGVFPGSRAPAYNNLPRLFKILELIQKKTRVNVVFGVSPKLDLESMRARSKALGSYVFTKKFGDALNVSDLVIALGGCVNEQAAGLGKPVVTFWGGGHTREEEWVKDHARHFLEGAALVLPPDADLIANNILSLLSDPAKMKKLGERGIELNGGRGGTQIMAQRIIEWLKKN